MKSDSYNDIQGLIDFKIKKSLAGNKSGRGKAITESRYYIASLQLEHLYYKQFGKIPEAIRCSAVIFEEDDALFLICGKPFDNEWTLKVAMEEGGRDYSHGACCSRFGVSDKTIHVTPGFISSKGIYRSRSQAYKIAVKAGQIKERDNKLLFSEDFCVS